MLLRSLCLITLILLSLRQGYADDLATRGPGGITYVARSVERDALDANPVSREGDSVITANRRNGEPLAGFGWMGELFLSLHPRLHPTLDALREAGHTFALSLETMTALPDGRVVLGFELCRWTPEETVQLLLVAFDPQGQWDLNFGEKGLVLLPHSISDRNSSIDIRQVDVVSPETILVSASEFPNRLEEVPSPVNLWMLNPRGQLSANFGDRGHARIPMPGMSYFDSTQVLPSGEIWISRMLQMEDRDEGEIFTRAVRADGKKSWTAFEEDLSTRRSFPNNYGRIFHFPQHHKVAVVSDLWSSADGTDFHSTTAVRVWDTRTQELVRTPRNHAGYRLGDQTELIKAAFVGSHGKIEFVVRPEENPSPGEGQVKVRCFDLLKRY